MSTNVSRRPFDTHISERHWGCYVALGLLALSCCFWSGLATWLFAPLTPFLANRLSYVQGKAELLVPAQGGASTGRFSPDGRRLLLRWLRDRREELVVWDLSTNARQTVGVRADRFCWLTTEQFIVNGGQAYLEANIYFIVQARDTSIMRATEIPEELLQQPGGFEQVKSALRRADQIFLIENFMISGDMIVALERGEAYVYQIPGSFRENIVTAESLTKDIPHIRIPDRCDMPPEGKPVFSPDGRYYTRWPDNTSQPIRIYSREGQVVAEAGKTGWYASLLGWAHDSSGIYFQIKIGGDAAAGLVPYQPIFKLSPLTPEEALWGWVWTALKVLGVGLALLSARWWWRRRRSGVSS